MRGAGHTTSKGLGGRQNCPVLADKPSYRMRDDPQAAHRLVTFLISFSWRQSLQGMLEDGYKQLHCQGTGYARHSRPGDRALLVQRS